MELTYRYMKVMKHASLRVGQEDVIFAVTLSRWERDMDLIRQLTDEEVATFREQGWVHAPGLISQDLAGQLLERARAIMGDQALVSTGAGGGAEDPAFADYKNILRNYLGMWRVEPLMKQVSHSPVLAGNVSRLLHGHAIRFFNDEVLVKPPAEEGGKSTPWHQDFPHGAFDRTGLVNIWFSLVDLPADGGAMSFLTGSHRHGPLGRTLLDSEDVLEQNPWLMEECPPSAVPAMKPGDATIHGDLTVHGGPAFRGPHWRWAYLVNLMDATIRYSGGPSYGEQLEAVEVNQPFPDVRYPVLYEPQS
jgi:hypothetical protein